MKIYIRMCAKFSERRHQDYQIQCHNCDNWSISILLDVLGFRAKHWWPTIVVGVIEVICLVNIKTSSMLLLLNFQFMAMLECHTNDGKWFVGRSSLNLKDNFVYRIGCWYFIRYTVLCQANQRMKQKRGEHVEQVTQIEYKLSSLYYPGIAEDSL